jgi:hypothetical protein
MKCSKTISATINGILITMFAVVTAHAANCTTNISSIPCTIASSGIYKLASNLSLSTTGAAISVATSNVVLDLSGYELKNTKIGYGDGIAYTGTNGILSNITIKNGRVLGFNSGIVFHNSAAPGTNIVTDAVVEGITVVHSGVGTEITGDGDTGINLDGKNIIIRNNIVDSNNNIELASIKTLGSNIHIINNDIFNPGNSSGILFYGDNGSVIENNRISTTLEGSGTGISAFIDNAIVANNRLINLNTGIDFGSNKGIYRDNLFIGTSNPVSGSNIFDAGNNKSF